MFKELNTIKKKEEFQRNLIAEIKKGGKTNNDIYKYCLENGFLPEHILTIIFPETALRSFAVYHPLPGNNRLLSFVFGNYEYRGQ